MRVFWRRWFARRDWDEELESHIAMRSEWNRKHLGLSSDESAKAAGRQFGGKLRTREAIEDVYPARWLSDLGQDLRHSLRVFWFSPGFALMIIGTICAGIAAATTIFSIVDPLLFRSLPFRDDKQLVSVGVLGPIDTNEFTMGSMYIGWRDHQTVFSSLTAMRLGTQCDVETSQTERVPCVAVEQNFLPTLGVGPIIGRNFNRDEDQPNAPRAMLISARLWRRRFGSQRDILGKLVKLDDGMVRVIGVLPSSFELPQGDEVDVLLPAQLDERIMHNPQSTVFLRSFARLKPGVSVREAGTRMAPLFAAGIRLTVPPGLQREVRPVIRSVRDRIVQQAKLSSRMLLGAVGLLLLMATLTVTNLLLARAHAQRSELAMRSNLGASRSRLARQVMTETLLLASVGGAPGFVMSWACIRLLVHVAPDGFLQLAKARADVRVLGFCAVATVLTAVLSSLLPALRRADISVLRTWRSTGYGGSRLRQALTSVQLACSLVLLLGALMFGRSLVRLQAQQPGFAQDHLTTVSLHLSRARYAAPQRLAAFYNQLEAKLAALPGTQAVALSDSIPPAGSVRGRPLSNILIAGRPPLTGASGMVDFRYVTPSYFRALQIPLIRGRVFTDAERKGRESSLVINDALARRLFASGDPIGERVSLNAGQSWLTIVGVVRDVKNDGINVSAAPEYYKLSMNDDNGLGLTGIALLRSGLDRQTLKRWVDQQIATLDPTASTTFETMPERLNRLNDRPRFLSFVLTIFAVVGVLLAASGLYGVIAFLVSARTREIGVRAALGATRSDIWLLMEGQMLPPVIAGIGAGLLGSIALSSLIRGLLFGISARDPVMLTAAALCWIAIALAATFVPCWRATHVDPAQVLRAE